MKRYLTFTLFTLFLFSVLVFALTSGNASDSGKSGSKKQSQLSDPEVVTQHLFSVGGPFAEFSPEGEMLHKRTETSKEFENTDGTRSILVGAGPVHYLENGSWKTILSYILPNSAGTVSNYTFASPHNRHKIFFPSKPGKPIVTQIEKSSYSDWGQPTLVWLDAAGSIISEINPNAVSGAASKDSLVYSGIFPHTDALIVNSVTTKKLNYVLKSPAVLSQKPAGAVYLAFRENVSTPSSWTLSGTEAPKGEFRLSHENNLYRDLAFKTKKGEPALEILRPLFYERQSMGDCTTPDFDFSATQPDGYLEGQFLIQSGKKGNYTSYLLVPISWLEAPHRKFPVTIDPITNFYPCASPGVCPWPTYTANRSNNSGTWACFAGLYAGRQNVFDISYGWVDDTWPFSNPYMDGYASFDISPIPANAIINSATTWWYRYDGRTCGDPIRLKQGMVFSNAYLAVQADCNVDGVSIRNNNGYYNGTGKNGTGWQNQAASIANVVAAIPGGQITMGWAYNGGDDCCTGCVFGVCTCTGNDGDYHHVYGYQHSTLRPYIRIDYCLPPVISAQPQDIDICHPDPMPVLSVTADGTGLTYQWQVSNNTACSGATNWQNIPGATGPIYTPPKITGTRLYRVVVTASDCPTSVANRVVNSNCVRVVVNPMSGLSNAPVGFPAPHGTGDNPPPIVFSLCGGIVLPGSGHTLNTLQPPAVGAVNNVTGYSWTASGGTITGSGSSVTWVAPATAGTYTIQVTYQTACGNFVSPICTVTVGSPDCDIVYVRPASQGGVNTPGGGGPDNPFATLAYAVSQLGGRTYIRIANGTYSENQRVNIPSNVIIEGAYDPVDNWAKTSYGVTLINFTANTGAGGTVSEENSTTRHLIGMSANGTTGWTLQDIEVTTAAVTGTSSGGRGSSNYALWLAGASGYNIIRCRFTVGAASQGAAGTSPSAATLRNNGSNGDAGHCDDNLGTRPGGAGGSAVGTGVRQGGAGGAGGQGSSHSSSNNTAGSSGSNGGGGAPGGTCGGSVGSNGGCGTDCDRDGRAGCDGAAGSNGANASTTPPVVNNTFGTYWVPNGQSASGADGHGGGGGRGGGGGGRQSGTFCDDGPGSGGGGGGSGGQGGQAGTGGWGGGGSFAIYVVNSSPAANFVNVVTAIPGSVSNGGSGGTGANGAPGGTGACGDGSRCNLNPTGGNNISGTRVCGNCEVGAGGKGGNGGAGGRGGNGQPGAPGRNQHMVTVVSGVPTFSTPASTRPISPHVTVLYEKGRACRFSEINILKASGTWVLPAGLNLVNDINETQSSFNLSMNYISVYSSSTDAVYNLSSPLDFHSFLRTSSELRPLPVIAIVPSALCQGVGAQVQLQHTNPWGTEVEYNWVVFNAATNNSNNFILSSNQSNPFIDVSAFAPGTYKVRFRVKEICCGWSIPVYATFTISPQPTAPLDLTKTVASNFSQACEGATLLSVNPASGSTGGTGTCNYEYSYQNTDGIWSAWQTAIPVITAGNAPGFVRIKARYNCDGAACQESAETPYVEWEIVNQPEPGAVSRDNPNVQFVCIGTILTADVSGGFGGVNPVDEIQWRIGTSGGWNNYTGPINTAIHGVGEYHFQTRRTSTGAGCNSSAWEPSGNGIALWFVYDEPIPPSIQPSPSSPSVCTGANLTVFVSQFGTGGAGNCADQVRYSVDSGLTWSTWTTIIPTVPATNPGTYLMQSRRKCDGVGCDSTFNTVSWNVVSDPLIGTPPQSGSTCYNATYSMSVSMSGGTGTFSYQWQESTVGCSGPWSNVGTNNPNYTTGLLTAPRYYQVIVTSSGQDCNTITSPCVTVTIDQNLPMTTWTGAVSWDWYNPYNWTHCVPGDSTYAIIPGGTPINPQIQTISPFYDGTAKCRIIDINSDNGADVIIGIGGALRVND